jgi:HEPN domain-containing protein
MSDDRLIANYLRIAAEDLAAAELLHRAGNRNAAYLCQQAAEKALRAVLTSEKLHGGTGHRLGPMVGLLPDANPMKQAFVDLVELEAYATTYRYPTSSRILPKPPADELRAHMARVDAVLDELAGRFGVDLAGQGPARLTSPLR